MTLRSSWRALLRCWIGRSSLGVGTSLPRQGLGVQAVVLAPLFLVAQGAGVSNKDLVTQLVEKLTDPLRLPACLYYDSSRGEFLEVLPESLHGRRNPLVGADLPAVEQSEQVAGGVTQVETDGQVRDRHATIFYGQSLLSWRI